MGWERSNERSNEERGREMLVLEMEGGDSVSWCQQGLRRELGRKERVCGGGCRLKALKYFLSHKRDLRLTSMGVIDGWIE